MSVQGCVPDGPTHGASRQIHTQSAVFALFLFVAFFFFGCRRTVKYQVLGSHIPPFVEVDVGQLDVSQVRYFFFFFLLLLRKYVCFCC